MMTGHPSVDGAERHRGAHDVDHPEPRVQPQDEDLAQHKAMETGRHRAGPVLKSVVPLERDRTRAPLAAHLFTGRGCGIDQQRVRLERDAEDLGVAEATSKRRRDGGAALRAFRGGKGSDRGRRDAPVEEEGRGRKMIGRLEGDEGGEGAPNFRESSPLGAGS